MTTDDIIKAAESRYDQLSTKPEWRDWYQGFMEGAVWWYQQTCPECDGEHYGDMGLEEKQP